MSRRKATAVPLTRDETWWLHPAFRGQQTLPLDSAMGHYPTAGSDLMRHLPIAMPRSTTTRLTRISRKCCIA